MAKQKNITAEGQTVDAVSLQNNDTAAGTPEQKQPQSGRVNQADPDSFILEILKSFPSHKKLYVDKQGGTFDAGTPKPIRGAAELYHNPFYKS